ncbi:sporulation inhibitor of replication protein SirA [Bacillus sp. CGMCC 1.16541]|uniref:sporulation inhibitor of replication protein SirA n=1 Tax=Bacillus sp. CGMCC 1.16541 TaxID=2185143 RepID=UPI0013A57B18|nr:sporulation inhibitor of replication protein SirA [Bacillus sp. CGMCC 1.16541]
MRTFYVFLLQEEVAMHYFRRESFLYDLFLAYKTNHSDEHEYIEKQVKYITKSIPLQSIKSALEQTFSGKDHFHMNQNKCSLLLPDKKSRATLQAKEQAIVIKADGSVDADTAFFEVLRKYDKYFLAVDFDSKQYGWLRPIKKRNFV